MNESLDLAVCSARAADDKQGSDTIIFDVGDLLSITGYFVVTSASNKRLVRAIADHIEERIKEDLDRAPLRVEGHREQQWVLIDYGDVIVHVFAQETRDFYEIERLYKDAARMEWRN